MSGYESTNQNRFHRMVLHSWGAKLGLPLQSAHRPGRIVESGKTKGTQPQFNVILLGADRSIGIVSGPAHYRRSVVGWLAHIAALRFICFFEGSNEGFSCGVRGYL
jgi:hypothetical protein